MYWCINCICWSETCLSDCTYRCYHCILYIQWDILEKLNHRQLDIIFSTSISSTIIYQNNSSQAFVLHHMHFEKHIRLVNDQVQLVLKNALAAVLSYTLFCLVNLNCTLLTSAGQTCIKRKVTSVILLSQTPFTQVIITFGEWHRKKSHFQTVQLDTDGWRHFFNYHIVFLEENQKCAKLL